jgi:hypothetical protein
MQPKRPVRANIPAMRRLYYVAAGLVFTLGGILFGLSTRTDRFFAWTIKVPLTAAFIGAAYLGSGFGELIAARARIWAQSRIAVPAVLLFSTLTGGGHGTAPGPVPLRRDLSAVRASGGVGVDGRLRRVPGGCGHGHLPN